MVDTPIAEPAPEPVAAPAAEPVAAQPEPTPEPTPPEPTPSTEDAVANAFKEFKVGEEGDPEPTEPDPGEKKTVIPAAEDPSRNPDGTFKAQEPGEKTEPKPTQPAEPVNFTEAPPRFSPDAKAAWKDAPEPIRAEIHRAVGELEAGIEKYRGQAAEYEPLQEYGELAKKHNTTIKDALDRYTNLERGLTSNNPTAAIAEVLSFAGVSAVEFAKGVMNAVDPEAYPAADPAADPMNSQQVGLIRDLRNEIASLRQQVGNVDTQVREQQQLQTQVQLETELLNFAATHPRTEELSGEMTKLLSSGYASDLADAYDKASRLIPETVAPQPTPSVETPAPEVQTQKAALSVTGAPSGGSDPVNRKTPSSPDEAVRGAFAQLGIR